MAWNGTIAKTAAGRSSRASGLLRWAPPVFFACLGWAAFRSEGWIAWAVAAAAGYVGRAVSDLAGGAGERGERCEPELAVSTRGARKR